MNPPLDAKPQPQSPRAQVLQGVQQIPVDRVAADLSIRSGAFPLHFAQATRNTLNAPTMKVALPANRLVYSKFRSSQIPASGRGVHQIPVEILADSLVHAPSGQLEAL